MNKAFLFIMLLLSYLPATVTFACYRGEGISPDRATRSNHLATERREKEEAERTIKALYKPVYMLNSDGTIVQKDFAHDVCVSDMTKATFLIAMTPQRRKQPNIYIDTLFSPKDHKKFLTYDQLDASLQPFATLLPQDRDTRYCVFTLPVKPVGTLRKPSQKTNQALSPAELQASRPIFYIKKEDLQNPVAVQYIQDMGDYCITTTSAET